MNINDINKFARTLTYKGQATIVRLKNEKEYVGYFENNTVPVVRMQSNKWNFMVFDFENEGQKLIEINGNDIVYIEIKNLI